MFTMSRLQRPRLTSSSLAASTSMCQFQRNCLPASSSMNDRWINAHRSCRSTSAYMLAGEGAILFSAPLCYALFHSLISCSNDFYVCLAQRKLAWLGSGGTGFDFVHPLEKLLHRRLIATRGLRRELHRRGL